MKRLSTRIIWAIGALCISVPYLHAQDDCRDENYSIPFYSFGGGSALSVSSDDGLMQVNIGYPAIGRSGSAIQGRSVVAGQYGHYELQPQAPIVRASQGEFLDRIEVEWDVIDQHTAPEVTSTEAKVFRNGVLMTTVPISQTRFVDYNVFNGEFYTYEIVTSNNFGDSYTMEAVGFLNPNGRITGQVKTRNEAPVVDAKVVLSPNLGRTLLFDGVDDYAFFDDEEFYFDGEYTIEGWFRNVGVQDQTMFSAADSGTTDIAIKVFLDADGRINYFHDHDMDGSGVTLTSREAYNTDAFSRTWHHFAAVHDSTHMHLYVNGRRVASVEDDQFVLSKTEVEIGRDVRSATGYYHGYLDEIRLWNDNRSRADLRRFDDITLTGEEESLMAYWKFDEAFGESIFDFAGMPGVDTKQHGEICGIERSDLQSPVQLGAFSDDGGDYIIKGIYYGAGQTFAASISKETSIGFSLQFDGIDDYLSFHLDRLPLQDGFTLEGWFKTGLNQDMTIFQATNPANDEEVLKVGTDATGHLVAKANFGVQLATVISPLTYADEFWHHYALVNDGAEIRVYVDETLVGKGSVGAIDLPLMRYVMARSGPKETEEGGDYFQGWLDEFRFWDHARSLAQISATKSITIPGDEQGIVNAEDDLGLEAYWMMGEGQGEIIGDATPNGHAGALLNYQVIEGTDQQIANWNGEDIPLESEFFHHDFDPNARNVSLDPSVTSVDRVDFTDISLLGVSGFVRYEATNCFVDSVEVLVNGESTLPPTYTDASGKFRVEFEPGSRGQILLFEKEDHEFLPPFVELPRLVRPISGLGLVDKTKRKLTGIVAGGECLLSTGAEGDVQVILATQPLCYSDTVTADGNGYFEFTNLPPQDYVVFVKHQDVTLQQYFDDQGAVEVNLTQQDDSISFIYRAPLEARISNLTPEAGCDKVILEQFRTYSAEVEVFETYYGGRCNQVSGELTINDDISDRGQQTVEFQNGRATYQINGGLPNILAGGERPYQKRLQIVAKDPFSRQAEDVLWVYVTGNSPRNVDFATTTPEIPFMILRAPPGDESYTYFEEGETFTTSTSFSLAADIENQVYGELSLGGKFVTEAGTPFFSTQLEVETVKTTTGSLTWGSNRVGEFESVNEISTSETISTVPGQGDVYVGGAMNILYGITDILKIEDCEVVLEEDVTFYPDGFATTFAYSEDFINGSVIPELEGLGKQDDADTWKEIVIMNHILRKSATLEENISFDGGASVERSFTETVTSNLTYETTLFIEPEIGNAFGFETNGNGFQAGKNTKMRIQLGKGNASTLQRERTIGYVLADNDFGDNYTVNVKADPIYGTPVFEMVSGASSCPFEGEVYDYANGLDNLVLNPIIEDLGADMLLAQGSRLVQQIGLGPVLNLVDKIDGVLDEAGIDAGIGGVVNEDNIDAAIELISEAVGGEGRKGNQVLDLILAAYDYPGVSFKNVRREGVRLTVDRNNVINVPEDREAVFTLSLGNVSETRESGSYALTLMPETNPNGAIVKVNGAVLSGGEDVIFTLQPDEQIDVTLTIEKGPESFEYEDLGIMLFSSCEKESADFLGFNIPVAPFASIQKLSASFVEVCSPISIFDPGDDWVITQASNNIMHVTLTDYVADRTDFTEVKLQYRQKIEGQPWINALEISSEALDVGSTVLPWDVTRLDDGLYEIRALTFCDAISDPRSSDILSGTIDRNAPTLFGSTSPADAILAADDEISIQFNEDIQCGDIIALGIPVSLVQGEANHVALSNTETGLYINAVVSCEGNKLVIIPDIQNKFIEEQVLRVDILGMEDLSGNLQTDLITWEFLVRRNPLEWVGGDVQDITTEGKATQFVRSVKNNGAFDVNVNLSGELDVQSLDETPLPSWITASPRSFTLQPGGTQEVTFTVSDQVGGGVYQDVVTAATSFGAPELRFDVRVLCPDPGWYVNASQFENSITFTGQLDIRGDLSVDEFDQVAAFVDGELRGVGNVTYSAQLDNIGEHPYLLFMTLYTNSVVNEQIDFQVWDASRCQLYGMVAENYDISLSTPAIGSPTNPASVTVTNNVIQEVPLSSGWNWFSFNLKTGNSDISEILASLNNERGDIVKSQTEFSQYVPGFGWAGPLAVLDSTEAFRIRLSQPDTLVIVGEPIDFETTFIELSPGWNWISFLPSVSMEINEALSGITASSDFLIKSQTDFAQFVDFQGWIGSLDFLRPNEGYLIFTDRSATLEFPVTSGNARLADFEKKEVFLPDGWALDPSDYESNSNIVLRVEGVQVESGDFLGAFVDGVLIGYAEPKYLEFKENYYFFLSTYHNHFEEIEFRLWRQGTQIVSEDKLGISGDQIVGSVEDPIKVIFREEQVLTVVQNPGDVTLYPNPLEESTTLSFWLDRTAPVSVELHDLAGKKIVQVMDEKLLRSGTHLIDINREHEKGSLNPGIYLVQLRLADETKTLKIIVR